jgi:hypothetical protein
MRRLWEIIESVAIFAIWLVAMLLLAAFADAQSALPPATSYEVNLTWQAPTDSQNLPACTLAQLGTPGDAGTVCWDAAASYDVFRAVATGSYARINAGAVTEVAYTDLTVVNGQGYSYYVDSVDAEGNLSAPSNTVAEVIPQLSAAAIIGKTT